MILRWTKWHAWGALAVAFGCAAILLYLVTNTALDKEAGPWAKLFLILIGVSAVIGGLVASEDLPKTRGAWLQPRPIAALFMIIFVAFGTLTSALSMFAPRPTVESRPGAIERDVKTLLARDGSPPTRIATRVPGVWGEPGCGVTYRFATRGGALVIDGLKRPAGAPPWRLVATITNAARDRLEVRGEEPLAARGQAATFVYESNGVTEHLTWDDRARATPLTMDRCA